MRNMHSSSALLVSIVVPTFNRCHHVQSLALSFLLSSDHNFELIIVDDGSSDNTYEILSKLTDPRLRLFRISNSERGKARNFGAKHAKGKYINFFDSDDLPYPNHLQIIRKIMPSTHYPEWFVFGYDIQHASGRVSPSRLPKASKSIMSALSTGNPFPPNSIFIRSDIALQNPFNESRSLAGSEDYELWLRLSMQYEPLYVPRTSTYALCQWYGRSVNNISSSKAINQYQALSFAVSTILWSDHLLRYRKSVLAGIDLYFALLLSSSPDFKIKSIQMLLYSILLAPKLLVSKRPYAVVKKLLFCYSAPS